MPRRISREDIHLAGSIATIVGTAILVIGGVAAWSSQTRSLVLHLGAALIGATLVTFGLVSLGRLFVAAVKRHSAPAPTFWVDGKALETKPIRPSVMRTPKRENSFWNPVRHAFDLRLSAPTCYIGPDSAIPDMPGMRAVEEIYRSSLEAPYSLDAFPRLHRTDT